MDVTSQDKATQTTNRGVILVQGLDVSMRDSHKARTGRHVLAKWQLACRLTSSGECLVLSPNPCWVKPYQVPTKYEAFRPTTSLIYRERPVTSWQILTICLMRLSNTRMKLISWLVICKRSMTCLSEAKTCKKSKRGVCQKRI